MAKEQTRKELPPEAIVKAGGEKMLRRVELPIDDFGEESLEVIISVPDRRTMGQYLKYNSISPTKAQEILVKACLHTDKEAVLSDDGLFLSCVAAIADLIPIRDGKIKKY